MGASIPPPRIEVFTHDECVVELVMAAALPTSASCAILSDVADPWSLFAPPQGVSSVRIVDLAASPALFAPLQSARLPMDGFILVLPPGPHPCTRFQVYPRGSITALLEDVLRELPGATSPTDTLLLGATPGIELVRDQIARVAPYDDVAVIVFGETGTGKELVAQTIHQQSGRPGPFVALNCAAIPESLFESELFGHEAGSFTGARSARVGLLEAAAEGTLFLDEVGEMPPLLQAKLLRVLETRTFRRLGSNRDVALDARIVSATNRPASTAGTGADPLRRDLLYRLAGFRIELPPLRRREADIELLADAFLAAFTRRHRRPPMRFSAAAREVLRTYRWPGNVRELKALVEQVAIVAVTPVIDRDDVTRAFRRFASTAAPPPSSEPNPEFAPKASGVIRKPLRDLERELIVGAFESASGNLSRAAAELGIPRTTLRDKLRRYGIVARPSESGG